MGENKVQLHDEVKPVASYTLNVSDGGTVSVTYQKQLEDDAPGDLNDQVLNVGGPKTLVLATEQSSALLAAIGSIISDAINEAEAASGQAPEVPASTEPPAETAANETTAE